MTIQELKAKYIDSLTKKYIEDPEFIIKTMMNSKKFQSVKLNPSEAKWWKRLIDAWIKHDYLSDKQSTVLIEIFSQVMAELKIAEQEKAARLESVRSMFIPSNLSH